MPASPIVEPMRAHVACRLGCARLRHHDRPIHVSCGVGVRDRLSVPVPLSGIIAGRISVVACVVLENRYWTALPKLVARPRRSVSRVRVRACRLSRGEVGSRVTRACRVDGVLERGAMGVWGDEIERRRPR